MPALQISNGRNDIGTTNDEESRSQDVTNNDLKSPATRRESTPTTYLNWFNHLSRNWILWCLIGDISQQEETQEIEHSSTMLPRIDSGIGIHLLGGNAGHPIRPAVSKLPTPIQMLFVFEDATNTKELNYRVYSQWINVDALLQGLAQNGIVARKLWDVSEDMQIGSGDWDARIQPGSAIEAWCFNDKRSYHSDDIDDSSESESEEDVECDCARNIVFNGSSEHSWWFTRWRQRVEKDGPGKRRETGKASWFVMVTCYITIVAIVILLSIIG